MAVDMDRLRNLAGQMRERTEQALNTPLSRPLDVARVHFAGLLDYDPGQHRDHRGRWSDDGLSEAASLFMTTVEGIEDLANAVEAVRNDDSGTEWHRFSGGASGAGVRMAVLPDGRRVIEKRAPDWGSGEPKQVADAEQLGSLLARRVVGDIVVGAYRDDEGGVWVEHMSGKTLGEHLYSDSDDGYELSDGHRAWLQTREAQLIGLADALMGNPDRNDGNVMFSPEGVAIGIDHGAAFDRLGYDSKRGGTARGKIKPENWGNPTGMPVEHFVARGSFPDNPLTTSDVRTIRQRLETLRPDFDKLDRGAWLDKSLAVLDILEQHAAGTGNLL